MVETYKNIRSIMRILHSAYELNLRSDMPLDMHGQMAYEREKAAKPSHFTESELDEVSRYIWGQAKRRAGITSEEENSGGEGVA